MDNGVKSFYLSNFANNLAVGSALADGNQGSTAELTNMRGLPPVYDAGAKNVRASSESGRGEVQSNLKNIIGYQKKGLLDILDRETTSYNQINGAQVNKPPTPLNGQRKSNASGGNAPPPLKTGPLQSNKITEDTLQESKRVIMTGTNRGNSRVGLDGLPSAKKQFN